MSEFLYLGFSAVIVAPHGTHIFSFGSETHDISRLHCVTGYLVLNASV
jgi:hypothetical protein